MAVADAVLPSPPPPSALIVVVVLPSPPPPPPPARVVVVAPALVHLPLALRVAAGVLISLGLAAVWIIFAATAAEVVARRAWGEGSAPVLFLHVVMYGALKVCVCTTLALLALVVLLLCAQCVGFKKMKLRRKGVRRILQGATVPIQLMVVTCEIPTDTSFQREKRVFADLLLSVSKS